MTTSELEEIFQEAYRVLKPEGVLTFIDLHQPQNLLFIPPLTLFMLLFETETAWQLLKTDLENKLKNVGFNIVDNQLYAGGSLQVIQAQK
jgi:demethylmenaquinone methyltransferase/2-methoxy-6-polyprenyl-1,4-benzoquinol methylase